MRAKVLDERGVAPNYVVTHDTLVHQPTGLSVKIDQPMTPRTLKKAWYELYSNVRVHLFDVQARADAAGRNLRVKVTVKP